MKKIKPEVSVIISAYNHEKYIAESIESVLNQTYKNFEIIVINDGSTDNTSKIINEIVNQNKDKITFIDHHKNQRPRLSGNQGVSMAKGRFIAWNDGDDIWFPTKLEKQMQIFKDDVQKKIGLVYCYGKNINENPNRTRDEVVAVDISEDVFSQLFASSFFFKISMVTRKEVHEMLGKFNERYPYCTDYNYILRIAAAGFLFDRVPEVLVGHRIHETNETKNRAEAMKNTKEMLIEISIKYKDLIKSKGIDVKHRLAVCDLQIAKYYMATGNIIGARKIFFPILFKYPNVILKSKSSIAYLLLSFMPRFVIHFVKRLKIFKHIFRTN